MNAFINAKIRGALNRTATVRDSIGKGYQAMVDASLIENPRDEDRYTELLGICHGCAPDGTCPACGCGYEFKLISPNFSCGFGRFSDG